MTEINAGRKTAGVDGRIVLAGWAEGRDGRGCSTRAAVEAQAGQAGVCAQGNGSSRGLGIPVIADRALQALAANALEPEWEARFEPRSYGFRPGRGCHDAIVAIFTPWRTARMHAAVGT